mmetsp:Transcript_2578/g.4691  ORF Transcript_2578/g.4691 Transcript_2578/m.4691 type:complete len:226 (+) Transcript_2578:36-713(+)
MLNRGMSRSSNFGDWVDKKSAEKDIESGKVVEEESVGLLGQLSYVQDGFYNQMTELSGGMPDTAEFRARLANAMYLLLGAIVFFLLAIFIGLPTIILKPSKFVLCMTLASLLSVASVAVLQKPDVFLANLYSAGSERMMSVGGLVLSCLCTIYLTVFVKRYVVVLTAAGVQIFFILLFLSSFIPGGTTGLKVLLKTIYVFVKTALKPLIFVCSKAINSFVSSLFS